jgi:hypothetical protein
MKQNPNDWLFIGDEIHVQIWRKFNKGLFQLQWVRLEQYIKENQTNKEG